MSGVQFIVDESGEKKAVVLDLAEWGELWEDLYDTVIVRARSDESAVPWQEVKKQIPAEADARGPV